MRSTLFGVLALLVTTGAAQAGSVLELPYPAAFGAYEAAAYGTAGEVVGDGQLRIDELDNGRVRLTVHTAIESGASMKAMAVLAPIEGKRALRLVEQRTESHDENGRSMGVLRVDHERGVASCTADGEAPLKIDLPDSESVINVPLNLLFQPLAKNPTDELEFQIFLCTGGPRVVDFSAARSARSEAGVIQVLYKPDLGALVNWVADSMIPKLSFWIDGDGNYVAHQTPLYREGPEVLLVREGLRPAHLAATDGPASQ